MSGSSWAGSSCSSTGSGVTSGATPSSTSSGRRRSWMRWCSSAHRRRLQLWMHVAPTVEAAEMALTAVERARHSCRGPTIATGSSTSATSAQAGAARADRRCRSNSGDDAAVHLQLRRPGGRRGGHAASQPACAGVSPAGKLRRNRHAGRGAQPLAFDLVRARPRLAERRAGCTRRGDRSVRCPSHVHPRRRGRLPHGRSRHARPGASGRPGGARCRSLPDAAGRPARSAVDRRWSDPSRTGQ